MSAVCIAFVILLSLLATTIQAGPYVPRGEKPVAKAIVATAQMYVHETFLAVESRTLPLSRDVSSIADMITEFAYKEAEAAKRRLTETANQLTKSADELSTSSTLCVRKCVQRNRIRDSIRDGVLAAAGKIYACTHAIANKGAGLEVEMMQAVTNGRAATLEVIAAMWFCQNDLPEPDVRCVSRLTEQGLVLVDSLPDKARMVLESAQSFGEQARGDIQRCVFVNMSNATETAVLLSEKLRRCTS